jgi:hypothetical protein
MTEAEWLSGTDPTRMLSHLGRKASPRKLRLLACGCARQVWDVLAEVHREAIELAERFADGRATDRKRREVLDHAGATAPRESRHWFQEPREPAWRAAQAATATLRDEAASAAAEAATQVVAWALSRPSNLPSVPSLNVWQKRRMEILRVECSLIRDIFGNSSHPVVFDPSWRTRNVRELAQAIYQQRTFERMPILADALEDAGCDVADLLNHCRGEADHVLGCWALDLILGQS